MTRGIVAAGGTQATSALDIATLVARGGTVTHVGALAQISQDQLREAVETLGGQFLKPAKGMADATADVIVVGAGGLPLTDEGESAVPAVRSTSTRVIKETEFLMELRIATEEEGPRLFTLDALAEILREPRTRVSAWHRAGLIRPAVVQHGVPRFDFQQVAAARSLAQLTSAGVSTAKLRRSLERLSRWLPEGARSIEQLDLLERSGDLLVRLEAGELAEADGQLQITYEEEPEPPAPIQLRLVPQLTAEDWHEQGVEQERHGLLEEAEDSYRRSLLEGGPDAQASFDLAHSLQSQGKHLQALERYRQVLEIDPRRADAWNNVGVMLAEVGQPEQAVLAFREALKIDPLYSMAHYNLADSLEALDQSEAALRHWREYLKLRPGPDAWSDFARRRVMGR